MRAEDYALLYALEDSFWWFLGMREITAALLDRYCAPNQCRQVLDAGCGTGGNLDWLTRYAGTRTVVGIDLSAEALDFCCAKTHKSVARASAADLPFGDSAFDLVTSFEVLGQLGCVADAEKALREMYRVLRPGGIAFIRVAAHEWIRSDHDRVLGTFRRYDLTTLVHMASWAGFQPLRASYANTLLLPAAALRRLVLTRIGLAAGGSDVKPLSPSFQWLNSLLTRLLYQEARWLRRPRTKLLTGLSAIGVFEKPRSVES